MLPNIANATTVMRIFIGPQQRSWLAADASVPVQCQECGHADPMNVRSEQVLIAAPEDTPGVTMSTTKPRRQAPFSDALAVVLIAIALACVGNGYVQAQQSIVGAPFVLVDQTGVTVTDETYRGKWVLIFFGFTHCADVCPTTLNKIANMMELLSGDAGKVQPLFITLDPERDTVAVMRDYVAAFDKRLVGLTGSVEAIAAVAKNYGVVSDRTGDAAAYTIDHSTAIYLLDPEG